MKKDDYIKQLEQALSFYADPKNYEDGNYWIVVNDEGRTARKALGREDDENMYRVQQHS